ncbi:replication restart DNA helicase PriA [Alkalithermobacter thermoalcaliphilus JW-YL-7 = DSM 7308]|uniref:Replication restart DNA helicase PriA n=1 Tax=Alkalithermobacter thermoalcaliphilus JW-YL-7 = DSM 7308 TaxID=1121328 RepID=A0A150FQH6_CLOPD|nr:hypothetical protein JWYL7_0938 [[Clostridium] paradoxum JW-YL-7 = DSM 7308]SHK79711.1 replication restart DNA helicase PriA [[Clostridium] paradoxum JW-YL-7 = DSM 7308]
MKKEIKEQVRKLDIKNMDETQKKAAKIFGMLILKRSILPLVLLISTFILSRILKLNFTITTVILLAVLVFGFFYIKKYRDKLQDLKYYEGKVIHVQKKGNYYELLLKNGKLPIKLTIKNGFDENKVRKNEFIRLYFNPSEKVAIIFE